MEPGIEKERSMKYIATALVLSFGLTGLSFGAVDAEVHAGINVSGDKDVNFNLFYEKLSPHGTWMEVKDYGWVWQPKVAIDTTNWRPYMNEGHWVNTDYGWYWVSDYEWGWAPFHYGRWTIVEDNKWVWIPGEHWAPAWVTWRESDRYFGWAPLPPDVLYQPGVGLEFRGKRIEANVDFGLRAEFFTFVPADHFLAENVATVAVAPAQSTTIYRETKIVNNSYTFNNNRIIDRGIEPQRVSQVTKHEVKTVKVGESNTPVAGREALKGDTLNAYKPEVKKDGAKTPKDFQQNSDKSGASAKSKAEQPVNTSVQNHDAKTGTITNNAQSSSATQQKDLNANKTQAPAQKPDATQPKAPNSQDLNANKTQAPAHKPEATQPKEKDQELKEKQPATKAPEMNERRSEANPPKDLNAPKAQEPAKAAHDAAKPHDSSSTKINDSKSERPLNTSVEPKQQPERAQPSKAERQNAQRANENARPTQSPSASEHSAAPQHQEAPNQNAPTEEMKQRSDTSSTKNDTEVKKSNPIR
jgi:hypothetical protein